MPPLCLLAALVGAAGGVAACDTEDATTAVIDNGYPAAPDGGDQARQTVVYRAWWEATYFPDPVPGGASSSIQRSVPASDLAYAVLAPGWIASGTPPATFVFVKSKAPFAVGRGGLLHIVISDETFTGNCAAKQPLTQADADFITQSIFPGELTNATYDAKTCTVIPAPAADGSADAGADADD